MNIDYSQYKIYIKDYLSKVGIKTNNKNFIKCINPGHADNNPSMQVYDDCVKCFSCSEKYDIFDVIGIFEGITDKKEQYDRVSQLYGSENLNIDSIKQNAVKTKKKKFIIDPEAYNIVTLYIRGKTEENRSYIDYLAHQRGYSGQLFDDITQYLGFWPGLDEAIEELGKEVLIKAGIPLPKPGNTFSAWTPSGVVARYEKGWKLFYQNENTGKTEKMASHGAHGFPYPKLNGSKEIILVEGEFDALAMISKGYENTVSICGTNGLAKNDLIRLHKYTKIIFLFDGDEAGKKAASKHAGNLFDSGYAGIISIATLLDNEDPDNLIKTNKIHEIAKALSQAKIFKNTKKENIQLKKELDVIKKDSDVLECYINSVYKPTHADFSDVIVAELKRKNIRLITEVINEKAQFVFYIQKSGNSYFEKIYHILHLCRDILEEILSQTFDYLRKETKRLDTLAKCFSESLKKCRTKDFLNSSIQFAGCKKDIIKENIIWNESLECLPCLDGILDFSGKKTIRRQPNEDEYFINPIKYTSEAILNSKTPELFIKILTQYFPNPETFNTAMYALSQMIVNMGFKAFQVWFSQFGNNGKNVLLDLMYTLLNGRAAILKPSVILRHGDKSEKRFEVSKLKGATVGFFDESAELEELAINEIKTLTSLSLITAEEKHKTSKTFSQTWTLALLTNELPRFYPADDLAFLNRLLPIPFSAVYYPNEDMKKLYLQKGVKPENLYPEINKTKLMRDLLAEGPGIIKCLIEYYKKLRDKHNLKIPLSPECKKIKLTYQDDNDTMKDFFVENFFIDFENKNYFLPLFEIKTIFHDHFGSDMKRGFLKKFCQRYKLEIITARYGPVSNPCKGIRYLTKKSIDSVTI